MALASRSLASIAAAVGAPPTQVRAPHRPLLTALPLLPSPNTLRLPAPSAVSQLLSGCGCSHSRISLNHEHPPSIPTPTPTPNPTLPMPTVDVYHS